MDYMFLVLGIVLLYCSLAISFDLVAGHGGMLAMSHAAFFGMGAYTSALLAVDFGSPFLLCFFCASAVAAVFSLLVSIPSLRIRGDIFVITTFGFQIITFNVFNNWTELTRGPLGIAKIPQPVILGWRVDSHGEFALLAAILAIFTYLLVNQISTSPIGRVLHAIREDEALVGSMGKNALQFKVTVFAISAALAASAGSIYAHYITYIDPTSFTVMESILVISMVIIGGAGSKWGPVIGALVLVVLPEALRFLGLPSALAANMRQIIYGGLLVLMMMFRPRGLVGNYGFGR
jgi:branched-chain amino acid transport system permease protein